MAYIAATVKDMMTVHYFIFFPFYFIKWYISLNVPERKGGRPRMGGVGVCWRECYRRNSRWKET